MDNDLGSQDNAALAAAERDINHGAFPGHPGRQCADGVDCLFRMETDVALGGTTGIIVLDAESFKYLGRTVVLFYRREKVRFPHRVFQDCCNLGVKFQNFAQVSICDCTISNEFCCFAIICNSFLYLSFRFITFISVPCYYLIR